MESATGLPPIDCDTPSALLLCRGHDNLSQGRARTNKNGELGKDLRSQRRCFAPNGDAKNFHYAPMPPSPVSLSPHSPMTFYSRASVYSAFFAPSDQMKGSIDRLAKFALKRAPKSVLDPCCGPGLWLEHFAKKGCVVAGSDLQAPAVASAEARLAGMRAVVAEGDMRDPPALLGASFDLCINLDNSIGHLGCREDVIAHFIAMRARMQPKSAYILGCAIREADDVIIAETVYERGPIEVAGGGFAALRTETLGIDPETRCERIRQWTMSAHVPECPPLIIEQYDLLTFGIAQWKEMFEASGGWEVLQCCDATTESLPSRPFTRGAGDVVLLLRPRIAATRKKTTRASVTKKAPLKKPSRTLRKR